MTDVQVVVIVSALASLFLAVIPCVSNHHIPGFSSLSLLSVLQGAVLVPLVMGVGVPSRAGAMVLALGLVWLLVTAYSRPILNPKSAVAILAGATVILLCGIALMWV